MPAIAAQIKNGYLVSLQPVDLPEGTCLTVEPRDEMDDDPLLGTSPEAIARWLVEFDALPTPTMTPEEETNWRQTRRKQREFEIANWEERARRIEGFAE